MAEKRMFSKLIIDSDNFLDMPLSSQALYFHLNMRADDDGFVNSPKRIVKMVNCSDDDIKILFAKQYLIPFESGVVVVKHWKIHNCIQKDRYKETMHLSEKKQLSIAENLYTRCIQNGNEMDPQIRLDKIRIDKISVVDSKEVSKKQPQQKFSIPNIADINLYCQERKNKIDAEKFYNYYEANGWMVGRNKMKDWKAAVRTWEKNNYDRQNNNEPKIERKYKVL